ncbi:MAG TPA: DUF5074 domain-containing protein [Cytophagaceae bacterium]|nr:DUF5074 domain-containing protein [Cytophagaceae bacterium]
MKQIRFSTLITAAIILVASACHKKPADQPVPVDPLANYNNGTGVFIVHEGQFGHNNSSVSFFNKNNNTVINNLYGISNNNILLGDVAQSMTIYNSKAYIVVNNTPKVEIAGLSDFKHQSTLTGLSSPRYLYVVDSSKAYISDWISNNIKILALSSNTLTGTTIPTGEGPEQMIKVGNNVYVANSGGFAKDSTVFVINATTNAVIDTIFTGINPTCLKVDKNNMLWILCSGNYPDPSKSIIETRAKLVMVNPSTNTVVTSIVIGNLGDHPYRMAINKTNDILYFENTGIYKFAITDVTAPNVPFITKSFYGIGVDYNTDIIYGADAKDFTLKGEIYRYNNSGVMIDSYSVGVVPSGFVFH